MISLSCKAYANEQARQGNFRQTFWPQYKAAEKAMFEEFLEGTSKQETIDAYNMKKDAFLKLVPKFHPDLLK